MQPHQTIIRRRDLPAIVGLSLATINRVRTRGDFPAPRQLGPAAVGFLRSDIDRWLTSRPQTSH